MLPSSAKLQAATLEEASIWYSKEGFSMVKKTTSLIHVNQIFWIIAAEFRSLPQATMRNLSDSLWSVFGERHTPKASYCKKVTFLAGKEAFWQMREVIKSS